MRSTVTRRLVRLAAVLAAIFGTLFATAGTASAAYGYYPGPGLYYGNQCLNSHRYVDNAGAEACLYLLRASGTSMTLAGGVYDYARDGKNVYTTLTVQNLSSTGGVLTSATQNVYGSNGFGYTKVANSFTVYKHASAPYVRWILRACAVEPSTGALVSCGRNVYTYWW